MVDIARLGVEIRTDGVVRATSDLDRFGRKGREAEGAANRLERSAGSMNSAFRGAAGVIAGAVAAIASMNAALRSVDQFTGMTNGLRAMGLSADQAAASLDAISAIATRTRSPLEATAKLYQRISVAGADLGATQQDVLRFTENVGLALAASGTSANEASGALLQLSQAMAGGVVRAEEFNSILEGAYPIALAAARGIEAAGGSVGQLRKLVVEGKISSEEFFGAILSQTDALEAAFASTVPTIGQATTVLGDSFTMMIGKMDAAIGVSAAIAEAILLLADNLDRVAVYAGTAAVAFGGAYVVSLVAAAGVTATLTSGLALLRAAIIRTGIGALVVGAGELIFQFTKLIEKTGSVGGAFNLLKEVAATVFERIGDAIGGAGNLFLAFVFDTVAAAQDWAADLIEQANGMVSNFVAGFAELKSKISQAFKDAWDAIKAEVASWPGELKQLGIDVIQGLIEGITSQEVAVGSKIRKVMRGGVEAANEEVDRNSPSRVFAAIGADLMAGVAVGVEEGSGQATAAIETAASGFVETYSGTLRQLADGNRTIAESYREAGQEAIDGLFAPIPALQALETETAKATEEIKELENATSPAAGEAKVLTKELERTGKAAKGAAKGVEDLSEEVKRLNLDADPLAKYNAGLERLNELSAQGLSEAAYSTELAKMNEELVNASPLLSGLNDAFGQTIDYMFNGFKDGMKGIFDIFKNTLKQMIATALKNRITIGLGLAASGGAGAAAAGPLGGVGQAAGGISSLFGGSGFLGLGGGAGSLFGGSGLLGLGGGSSIFGLGAGSGLATALGGGAFGAAASVALPIIGAIAGIGLLFKKTEVVVANGVNAIIDGASIAVQSYEKSKTNNGIGISSGFKRKFTDLDEAVQSAVQARLDATIDALGAFGLGTDLTGFSSAIRTEIKEGETFEGELEEVISGVISEALTFLSDGTLEAFQNVGEDLAATLTRLTTSLQTVNQANLAFGAELLPISLDAADAASALIELSGGLDAFAAQTAFLAENFFTDDQKLAENTKQLNSAFDALGVSVPETHQQFLDLRNAQDLMTEEGQNLHAALSALAPLFVTVRGTAQEAFAQVQEDVNALYDTLLGREADAEGFKFWTDAVFSGAVTLEEAARLISLSEEAQAFANSAEEINRGINTLDDAAQEVARLETQLADLRAKVAGPAAERQLQLERLLSDEARNLQREINSLTDALEAQAAATRKAAEVTQEREQLTTRLANLQGNTEFLRQREINSTDKVNRALLNYIHAVEDAQEAFNRSVEDFERAQRVYEESLSLSGRIFDLIASTTGSQEALAASRQLELRAIDESNRALQEHIYAIEDTTKARREADAQLEAAKDKYLSALEKELRLYEALVIEAQQALIALGALVPETTPLEDAQQASQELQDALAQLATAIDNEIGEIQSSISGLEGQADALRNSLEQIDDNASRDLADAVNQRIALIRQEIVGYNELANASFDALVALGSILPDVSPLEAAQSATQAFENALTELASGIDREIGEIQSSIDSLSGEASSLRDALFPSDDVDLVEALRVRDVASDALSIAERLADAAREVFSQEEAVVELRRESAIRQLRTMLEIGRIDEARLDSLVTAATNFGEGFTNRVDMLREQGQTAATLNALAELQRSIAAEAEAAEAARVEEARATALAQLASLEDQITQGEAQLAALESLKASYDLNTEELSSGALVQNVEALRATEEAAKAEAIAFYQAQLSASRESAKTGLAQIENLQSQYGLLEGIDTAITELNGALADLTQQQTSATLTALSEVESRISAEAEQSRQVALTQIATLEAQIAQGEAQIAQLEALRAENQLTVQELRSGELVATIDRLRTSAEVTEEAALAFYAAQLADNKVIGQNTFNQIVKLQEQFGALKSVESAVFSVSGAISELAQAQAATASALSELQNVQQIAAQAAASQAAAIAAAQSAASAAVSAPAPTAPVQSGPTQAEIEALKLLKSSINQRIFEINDELYKVQKQLNYWQTIRTDYGVSQREFYGAQGAQLRAERDSLNQTLASLPSYADGGFHSGGLAMVGEEGPELVNMGPSRVWTADQTERMMRGGGDNMSASELRALRQEVAELNRAMVQTVKNTKRTSDTLRTWDQNGQPETRDVTA